MWKVFEIIGSVDKDKSVRAAGEFPTKRKAYAAALSIRGAEHAYVLRQGHTYSVRAAK